MRDGRKEVRRPRFQTVVEGARIWADLAGGTGLARFLCGFFMVNPLLPLHTGAKVEVSRRNRA